MGRREIGGKNFIFELYQRYIGSQKKTCHQQENKSINI